MALPAPQKQTAPSVTFTEDEMASMMGERRTHAIGTRLSKRHYFELRKIAARYNSMSISAYLYMIVKIQIKHERERLKKANGK
jgi:hypothetical protein